MSKTYKCVLTASREMVDFLKSYISSAFSEDGFHILGDSEINQYHIFRLPMNKAYEVPDKNFVLEGLAVFVKAEDRNNYFFTIARENCFEFCSAEYEEDDWKDIDIYSEFHDPKCIYMRTKQSFKDFLNSEEYRRLEESHKKALKQYDEYLDAGIASLRSIDSDYHCDTLLSVLCP